MSASQREDRTRLDGVEIEIFKLVRKGATSEQWREWLRVPLEHAAADGNVDLFSRLMDAGADGSAGYRGCHGRPLLAAAAHENEEMVVALLRAGAKGDVNITFGGQQDSALHVAASLGAEGASRALMCAGADPSLPNAYSLTPLHLAAEQGHHGVVSDLLVGGADPSVVALNEETPLHLAADRGHVSCVSKLLLGGADKNSRNSDGKTPLYMAAQNKELDAIEELLAAKADPDIRDDYGCRPLDIAAVQDNNVEVLRVLVLHGGDVKACDDDGYTALHHVADVDGPDREYVNSGSVRLLLEAGADIEAKANGDYGCRTPLHVSVCRRGSQSGTVCALLRGGADVNGRDERKYTPLHYACSCSNVGGVELLLRWGADETLEDELGGTPADEVGVWEQDQVEDEERKADDKRIRHMLARAPADRSWRRRGWLVLARSRPDRVQLVNDSRSRNGDSSTKVAKARCDGFGAGGGRARSAGDQSPDLACLVDRVVGLDADGVFRLIVGFL